MLALSQSEGLTKGSDKGLLLEISALKTLNNGQFTLSTQLINQIIFLPLSSTNYALTDTTPQFLYKIAS